MLQSKIERERLCDQWTESSLMSRVIQKQGFLSRFRRTELSPPGSVPDSNRQCALCRAVGGGCDTDPAADQSSDHCKETRSLALNVAAILPIGRDVGEAIQHSDAGHFDMVEPDPAVIDAV